MQREYSPSDIQEFCLGYGDTLAGLAHIGLVVGDVTFSVYSRNYDVVVGIGVDDELFACSIPVCSYTAFEVFPCKLISLYVEPFDLSCFRKREKRKFQVSFGERIYHSCEDIDEYRVGGEPYIPSLAIFGRIGSLRVGLVIIVY